MLFAGALHSPSSSIICYAMCEDIGKIGHLYPSTGKGLKLIASAGTMRQAETRPNIPASRFPKPVFFREEQSVAKKHARAERPEMNTSKRRINDVLSVRELSVTDRLDEYGDDGLLDSDLNNLIEEEPTRFEHIDNYEICARENVERSFAGAIGEDNKRLKFDTEVLVRLPNGKFACRHQCRDKTSCRHLCCREGLDRPPRGAKKETPNASHSQPEGVKMSQNHPKKNVSENQAWNKPKLRSRIDKRDKNWITPVVDLTDSNKITLPPFQTHEYAIRPNGLYAWFSSSPNPRKQTMPPSKNADNVNESMKAERLYIEEKYIERSTELDETRYFDPDYDDDEDFEECICTNLESEQELEDNDFNLDVNSRSNRSAANMAYETLPQKPPTMLEHNSGDYNSSDVLYDADDLVDEVLTGIADSQELKEQAKSGNTNDNDSVHSISSPLFDDDDNFVTPVQHSGLNAKKNAPKRPFNRLLKPDPEKGLSIFINDSSSPSTKAGVLRETQPRDTQLREELSMNLSEAKAQENRHGSRDDDESETQIKLE